MEALFIQGPRKTATSTITGILNCHPEIFVLFENYFNQLTVTKYGNQTLERYPEARKFFKPTKDFGQPVIGFFNFLKEKDPERSYKYIGTKINDLDPSVTQKVNRYKIIFTIRDISTWLVKESVIKYYRTDLDAIHPAIEYMKYIINTCRYEHAYRLRMNDLILKNRETLRNIENYLDIDLFPSVNNWWDKIGEWHNDDPKSMFRLKHVHHSSRVEPNKLDTTVNINSHPMWDIVIPLYERYAGYSGSPNGADFKHIESDLNMLEKLEQYAPLPYEECYANIHSIRFGYNQRRELSYISKKNEKGTKRSILSYFIHRIKRILRLIVYELKGG